MDLHVRNVRGRYGRGVLRSENVVATVTEISRVYRIRIDDENDPAAWLEIVVESNVLEGVSCMTRNGHG